MTTIARVGAWLRPVCLAAAVLTGGGFPAAAGDFSSSAFEGVLVKTSEAPATVTESSQFAVIGGAVIEGITVPPGDSDLFTVLFTGQVEMQNATANIATLNEDALLIRIQAVGVGTTNLSPTTVGVALASADSVASYSVSAAVRLPIGSYKFRVVGKVRDTVPLGTVSAVITNWMMTVTRYN